MNISRLCAIQKIEMKKSRKKLRLFLLLVGVLVPGLLLWSRWRPAQRFEAGTPSENELRVATWNVGYFAATGNKNLRDTDVPRISAVIKDMMAQVVVIQEIGSTAQVDQIVDDLGSAWQARSVKTGHGEQILAVISNLEILEEDVFTCGGRQTLGLSLAGPAGKSIYVVGVHSPHPAWGIQENDDNIRCALNHGRERHETVRIVTGDMNYNFDDEASNSIFKGFLDVYGDGTLALGETYYAHTRIDHLFYIPKDLKVNMKNSGILDLPIRFAKVPGFRDHRPIVVSFDLSTL